MFKRLLSTLEILRPHNMVAAGACVYSGYYLSGGRAGDAIAWPVVSAAVVAGLANLVNDAFDADIDRVNKPRRPIPSGRLSRRDVAWAYGAGTAALTGAMIVALPAPVLALMVAWEVLLFLYAASAKRMAFVGNLLISAVCASAFAVGPLVAGGGVVVVFPACFAFVFVMGRELVKGAEDVEGDSKAGAKTLAVRFGPTRTAGWAAMLLFICTAAAPIPALVRYFGGVYGLLVQLLFVPGVLAAACLVLKSPRRETFHRASWILKAEMLVGIVAIGLGRT